MDSKIDTFGQIDIRDLAILGGRKSRFLDFFKVILELFRKSNRHCFRSLKSNFWVHFQPYLIFFATHSWSFLLGSRKAQLNVDKALPRLLVDIQILTYTSHSTYMMGWWVGGLAGRGVFFTFKTFLLCVWLFFNFNFLNVKLWGRRRLIDFKC